MLKTHIDKAKVVVTARFKNEGSVLRETVQAEGLGVETRCEITSNEAPEKIAKVIRTAEAGCYVIQTIRKPTPVTSAYVLNGNDFDPESFQKNSRPFIGGNKGDGR
jgi:organic hydroperoxide reductase OsmC/OhrA